MITYQKLDIDMLSPFADVYRECYKELEGKEMTGIAFKNWFLYTIGSMGNPDNFNLLACDGKVAGFIIVQTLPAFDGIKTISIDSIYVRPEYRNQGISKKLVDDLLIWMETKEIKRSFVADKIEGGIWLKKQSLGFKPYKMLLVREA